MKKRLLMILCCIFVICNGVVTGGCDGNTNDYSDSNDYMKYELLVDGTYCVGLKEDYLESFAIGVDESFVVPSIKKQTNKIGGKYDKIPRHIEVPNVYNGKPVTKIADCGFSNNNIESIILPDSITQIGVAAFYGTGLAEISIHESVTAIEDYAFCENNLSALSIPDGTQRIGRYAFAKNCNLSDVNLGNGIYCLDKGLFCGCVRLKSIVIPTNIRLIRDYVFSNIDNFVGGRSTELDTIYFKGDVNDWTRIEKPDDFSPRIEILYYTKDGDIAKFIDVPQSIKRVWTYNDKQEIEIINLVYDNAIDGKTYFFSYSDINITDDGWNMLLLYDKNDKLKELLTNNEIAIFKKSNNKDEYETMIEAYYLENYSDEAIVFKNEVVTTWRYGKPDFYSYYYKLVNGEVYINIGMNIEDDYRRSYILADDTLIEEYDYDYGSEKFYFKERQ